MASSWLPRGFLARILLVVVCAPGAAGQATAGWPATHTLDAQPGYSWSAGNHRFSIVLDRLPAGSSSSPLSPVTVTIPWRRHDRTPELVDAFLVDARSHLRVPHCTRLSSTQDNATFIFAASNGPAEYHLYYMPFKTCEYQDGSCPYGANVSRSVVCRCLGLFSRLAVRGEIMEPRGICRP
jgi:hypothetical protein